jgi:hypothetical protein
MAYRRICSATEVAAFTSNIHPAIVDIAPQTTFVKVVNFDRETYRFGSRRNKLIYNKKELEKIGTLVV